jgi:hypothetical protein
MDMSTGREFHIIAREMPWYGEERYCNGSFEAHVLNFMMCANSSVAILLAVNSKSCRPVSRY